ncbi:MAG: hypothetical protein ACKOXM_02270 [Agromyces sp.]
MSQPSSGRPLPAYIYRRRRLAVFGVLVFIVVLILLVTHPWSGAGRTSSPDTVSTLPSATEAAQPSSAEGTTCAPSHVKVLAYTDAESYAAGQNPQLTVEVKNVGSAECVLNVGTSQQVFTITSGSEMYWVSTDCQTESSDYELMLQPGQSVKSEPIQWDRTRSNPGTCMLPQRDPVPAGGAAYHLTVTVGGISSTDSAQFTLN